MSAKLSWDERYRRGRASQRLARAAHWKGGRETSSRPRLGLGVRSGPSRAVSAERRWRVTAVDASRVAIETVQKQERQRGPNVDARVVDLEK